MKKYYLSPLLSSLCFSLVLTTVQAAPSDDEDDRSSHKTVSPCQMEETDEVFELIPTEWISEEAEEKIGSLKVISSDLAETDMEEDEVFEIIPSEWTDEEKEESEERQENTASPALLEKHTNEDERERVMLTLFGNSDSEEEDWVENPPHIRKKPWRTWRINLITPEKQEDLLSTYLTYYDDIKNGKITLFDITTELAAPLNSYSTLLRSSSNSRFKKKDIKLVVAMYRKKKSFEELQEKTRLSYKAILKILYNNLGPNEIRPSPVKMSYKEKAPPTSEKEKRIIRKWRKLKKNNQTSRPVSFQSVHRELNEGKIFESPGWIPWVDVWKTLHAEGVKPQHKSKDLTPKQKTKLVAILETKDLTGKRGKKPLYSEIAKKMHINTAQVSYFVKHKWNQEERPRHRKTNVDEEGIVTAYDELSNEDKLNRAVPAVREKTGHSTDTIRRVLTEHQKFQSNGKKGLWARNVLAPGYQEEEKSGRKRKDVPASSKPNAKKVTSHKKRRLRK